MNTRRTPLSRNALSWILLLGSAWALVATSEARWEVRSRVDGDTFALGAAPVHRRVLLVLNPAGVAEARRTHRHVMFSVDATATVSGTSPPAKIHVRVVAVDPLDRRPDSFIRLETHSSADLDCGHRACVAAFDVLFEAIPPLPANGPIEVRWSVASEAGVLGSSATPRGAALSTQVVDAR